MKKEISKYVFRSETKGDRAEIAKARKEFIKYLEIRSDLLSYLDIIRLEQFPYHYYSRVGEKAR